MTGPKRALKIRAAMGARTEWTITRAGSRFVRIKKWTAMIPGEPFQESTFPTGASVIPILQLVENEVAASEMFAELHGRAQRGPIGHLDNEAWKQLRRAFERGVFVIVPLDPPRDWSKVPDNEREVYVMRFLIEKYKYPVTSAAGIVGNLERESGLYPNMIEGSAGHPDKPMTGKNFSGHEVDFTPTQIRNRSERTRTGPRMPGIGLAQWTYPTRRRGLFERTLEGHRLEEFVLLNMDAQIAYVVEELRGRAVNATLMTSQMTVDEACDAVLYGFERPGVLDYGPHHPKPRSDPNVQKEINARRHRAQSAFRSYEEFLKDAH